MTLYPGRDGEQGSVIPPVPSSSGSMPQQNASSSSSSRGSDRRPSIMTGTGTGFAKRSKDKRGGGGALSKASEVGSNLKKRFSMRYAEPTEIDASGYSAIPEVPSMPGVVPGAPDLPPGSQYQGYGQEGAMQGSRPMPMMGRGFEDIDEHGEGVGTYEEGVLQDGSNKHRNGVTHIARSKVSAMDTASLSGSLQVENFAHDPAIDLDMLSSEDFDPQLYLKMRLSTSSETFLRQFQESLRAAKEAANSDLKRQVFHSYQDFITISKEIATLENDMLELKELLGEWKTLPQALELEEGGSSIGALTDSALRGRSLRGNRNSMVDLHQIYKAQITSLWEGIEGSQKFLPFVPGRHLIAEASSFTELNSATYKPKQGVALFLLDDLLLVAVRKKRQMSARVRLVAERCFSLTDIIVIDLKDGGDLSNAIKIKRGKESFVYRSERSEDKRALLNAFRRVAEELANRRRKESRQEAESRIKDLHRGSISNGTSQMEGNMAQLLADAEGKSGTDSSNDASGLKGKDSFKWLSDLSDQVSVSIAMRQWNEAVTLLERGQNTMSSHSNSDNSYRDASIKMQSLTSQLVEAITFDLSSPLLKKSAVVRNVGYLLRLDRGEKAREVFLQSRSDLLKKRSRQIKFEGDVSLYISELALVHFTLIKNTSEWYMSAFKDNRMASGECLSPPFHLK